MDITSDHYTLLGLPRKFALDTALISQAHHRLQSQVHPDRHVAAGAAAARVATQWAARANEALRVLSDPLTRARYLCELNGVAVVGAQATPLAPDFLLQQMQWRESLEELTTCGESERAQAIERLCGQAQALRATLLQTLEPLLDLQQDFVAAAGVLRQLMFVQRFIEELSEAAQSSGTTAAATGRFGLPLED